MRKVQPVRSALLVPALQLDRLSTSFIEGADALVVDLSEAVTPQSKYDARSVAKAFLDARRSGCFWLRVNVEDTEFSQDLQLCRHPHVSGIVVPRAFFGGVLGRLGEIEKAVYPVIETARGLVDVSRIAELSHVKSLIFGGADLLCDVGISQTASAAKTVVEVFQTELVVRSAAAGLAPPIDALHESGGDLAGLEQAARRACEMGFQGKLCDQPSQVAVVRSAFAPRAEDVNWARGVLSEAQGHDRGVFMHQGRMVDTPVLDRARRIIERERLFRESG